MHCCGCSVRSSLRYTLNATIAIVVLNLCFFFSFCFPRDDDRGKRVLPLRVSQPEKLSYVVRCEKWRKGGEQKKSEKGQRLRRRLLQKEVHKTTPFFSPLCQGKRRSNSKKKLQQHRISRIFFFHLAARVARSKRKQSLRSSFRFRLSLSPSLLLSFFPQV